MNLTQKDWASKLYGDANAVILDVRTKEETLDGVIPEAVRIDIYQNDAFLESVRKLDKRKNYYVYCKAGGRSERACQIMNEMGFSNTYNLIGGMTQWSGEITFPVD